MTETLKQAKKEIKKLVNACIDDSEGFRASEQFAELKRRCKRNESSIDLLYRFLKAKLRHHYVETRISALNIADEFFMRSHLFRTSLLDELNEFVDCVLDVRLDTLLSGSRDLVRDLRKLAIRLLKKWQVEFGSGYPQLTNVFEYLRYSKRLIISDEDNAVITRGDIRERLERERREEQMATRKLASAQGAYAEFSSAMNDCRAELDSLVQIFRSSRSNSDPSRDIPSTSTAVTQPTAPTSFEIFEDEENRELVELFLRNRYKLEIEYTPKLQTVIRSLTTSLSFSNVSAFVRDLVETKSQIEALVRDAKSIRVLRDRHAARARFSLSTDDDDAEFVTKFGKSSTVAKAELSDEDEEDDDDDDDFIEVRPDEPASESRATSSKATQPDTARAPRTETGPEALEEALEIGTDTLKMLQSSGAETVTDTVSKRVTVSRRDDSDWVKCDSNEVELPASFCADLQRRVFTFAGRFEPVTRCCNAPLGPSNDGAKPRLCPRRDREKCPFHGTIVDRDEFGRPIAAAAAAASNQDVAEMQQNEAGAIDGDGSDVPSTSTSNARLGESIAEAIREDLREHVQQRVSEEQVKRGRGRRKRRREPEQTPRDRLTQIVLDRRTLQRVGEAEDHSIHSRNQRRFAQQFNYLMKQ